MYTECIACHIVLTNPEMRRRPFCVSCMMARGGQATCYICKKFFTLDNLYVTTRDGKGVDICKECSINTPESISNAWISHNGTTWQPTWYTPTPPMKLEVKSDPDPDIIEPKPRRLKIKET